MKGEKSEFQGEPVRASHVRDLHFQIYMNLVKHVNAARNM